MKETVPLVIYNKEERVVVGTAVVEDQTYIEATLYPEYTDLLKVDLKACSISTKPRRWFLP